MEKNGFADYIDDMDTVIKYGDEAGEMLKAFSSEVMLRAEKSYEILCKMDDEKRDYSIKVEK